jgi:glycosyltransferase involved in cell wall biosynthesis
MKICFIASSYPRHETDGSARFIRSMAEALVEIGHTVDIAIPYRADLRLPLGPIRVFPFRYIWPDRLAIMGYAEAMESDQRLRGLAYALVPAFALAEARQIARLHCRYGYDIIHANWVIPNGAVAALVAAWIRRPLVISLHGSDIFFARRHALLGALAGWAFRRAAGVTACSPELRVGAIALGADPGRLHLVPWGADPRRFAVSQGARDRVRAELGLRPDQPVLLSLGRLVKKKGIEYLIHALPDIVRNAPKTVCLVAGNGPEAGPLAQLAAELGVARHVRFLGAIPWPETPALYAAADIFVTPSIHDARGNVDGLPSTILEAMAASRPIIASQVAGIELAVTDGIHGLLTPERDAAALARAAVTLIQNDDLRNWLGENGRARVRQELNWMTVAHTLDEIYAASVSRAAINKSWQPV